MVSYLQKLPTPVDLNDFAIRVNITNVLSDGTPVMLIDIAVKFTSVITKLVDYYVPNSRLVRNNVTGQLVASIGASIQAFKNLTNASNVIASLTQQRQRVLKAAESLNV
jgi:hypothetical protein